MRWAVRCLYGLAVFQVVIAVLVGAVEQTRSGLTRARGKGVGDERDLAVHRRRFLFGVPRRQLAILRYPAVSEYHQERAGKQHSGSE